MKLDSIRSKATGHSIKLDPKRFKSDPTVYGLVQVISANIELHRLDRIDSEPPFEGLLGGMIYPSEATPWYELLTSYEVLQAIVRDTSWELDALCNVIVNKLMPSNWEVFFWMGIAIKADRDEGRVLNLFSDAREARKKNSQKAGKRSGVERKRLAKLSPEKARQERKTFLDAGHEKRDTAALIAKKHKLKPQYVRELLRQKK